MPKPLLNFTLFALIALLPLFVGIVNASTTPRTNDIMPLLGVFGRIVNFVKGLMQSISQIFATTSTSVTTTYSTVVPTSTTTSTSTTSTQLYSRNYTIAPANLSQVTTTIDGTKFNLTAAEASGAEVFNDSSAPDGYVYSIGGIVYDIYGDYLYNSNPNPFKPYWDSCVADASFSCGNLTYNTTGILRLKVGQMPGFYPGYFAFVPLKDSDNTINSSSDLNYTYLSSLNYAPTASDSWLVLNVSLPVIRGTAISGYIWDRYWAGNTFHYTEVASIEARATLNSSSTTTIPIAIKYPVTPTVIVPSSGGNGSFISRLYNVS